MKIVDRVSCIIGRYLYSVVRTGTAHIYSDRVAPCRFRVTCSIVAVRPAGKYKSAVRHACDVRAVTRLRTELSKCSPLLRWCWREVYFFFLWCNIVWRERSDLDRRRPVTATRRCESRDVQWAGRP